VGLVSGQERFLLVEPSRYAALIPEALGDSVEFQATSQRMGAMGVA
jgi:hypothetical protein